MGLDFAEPPASLEDLLPARSRLYRGVTLIELMTAVAIIAVLASLAVTLMVYGTGRARMNNTIFDLSALISAAQLSALNRGTPHYVIIYRDPDGEIQAVTMERPDAPPLVDWNNLDLAHVAGIQEGPWRSPSLVYQRIGAGGVVQDVDPLELDRLKLGMGSGPDSGGISFLDLDSNRINRPLQRPFNTIPLTSTFNPADVNQPTTNLLAGCSFCVAANGVPYGVIRFNTNGTVEMMTGASATGGSIAFMPNTPDERNISHKLLIISAPAGVVHTF